MPTDYRDDESFEKYVNICAHIGAIFTDSETAQFMLIGDLNCQIEIGSRFFEILSKLISEFNLIVSDTALLSNAFTYCSDNGLNRSWIDHIITNNSVHNDITSITVLYDYICSDHKPLSATVRCKSARSMNTEENCTDRLVNNPQWASTSSAELYKYVSILNNCLSKVYIPDCLFDCSHNCSDLQHNSVIDVYYSNVMNCVKLAVECTIPKKCVHISEYNVPGWN